MDTLSSRLDNFTDAAFAFAVTMLIVGGGGTGIEGGDAELLKLIRRIPAFGIGYAIIGMFWYAHVRWRHFRGSGDWRSVLLTFLLVFIVLIYVFPLAAMSQDMAAYMTGTPNPNRPSVSMLFAVYGVGFVAMSAAIAALFWDAAGAKTLADNLRRAVRGEAIIYLILGGTGLVSVTLALIGGGAAMLAPWAYATLPLSIGVFAGRWRWE